MTMRRFACLFPMLVSIVSAQSVRIAQIDNSSLLLNQKIKLYINIADREGNLIKDAAADQFQVFESIDGNDYTPIPGIIRVESKANYVQGINLMLLLDNSGSMYRNMTGARTTNVDSMRITFAKRAAQTFLKSVTNPKDRIGLASYHSFYTSHTIPTRDKVLIERALDEIIQPQGDELHTELYGSLHLAVDEFRSIRGRKAIIMLSDGENSPYYSLTKKEHPRFGAKIFTYDEPVAYCQQEGISVFAINFGKQGERGDRNLTRIATQTGGIRYDAHNQEELNKIYGAIMDQILNEYLITYKATMTPADRKYAKVRYSQDGQEAEVARFYFSSTIFGTPLEKLSPLLLLPLLIAFLLLWLLSRLKFERQRPGASLEVLATRIGKTSTRFLPLDSAKTVIGRTTDANMTILGDPEIREHHVTITYDEKKRSYTLIGDVEISINNKLVRTKVLEPGDVIDIGGTKTVFDEGFSSPDKNSS